MNRIAFLLLFLIGTCTFVWAQDPIEDERSAEEGASHDASIMVTSKATHDGVILRWAPDKPGAFHILNSYGYRIERTRIAADGSFNDASTTLLTPEPLRPWPIEEWRRRIMADTSQISLAAAAQMLYGTAITPAKNPNDDLEVLRNGVRDAENRFGFALMLADTDPRIAEGMALRFVDRDVRRGERVVYRIMPARQSSDYVIDTAVVVVVVEPEEDNIAPQHLRFTSGDGSVTLQWDQHELSTWSAWHVERSDDEGRTWTTLTKRPHVIIAPQGEEHSITPSYEDKNLRNYQRYTYRVRGINAFGERSRAAEIVAWAVDNTAPNSPTITRAEQFARDGVVLTWEHPGSGDLKGFVVSRAANPKSGTPFTPLHQGVLTPDTRMFMDHGASDREAWYMVSAIDTSGNSSESVRTFVQIIDSLPPSAPRNVLATVDSTGVVTLRWNSNAEDDIAGYRVLWANARDHEFSQLTPHIHADTVITHSITLNTSTPSVFYKVVAVDKRYMHSAPSEVIELRRPDILPPDAPVFTDMQVSDLDVRLRWARSGSEDVVAQHLERREAGAAWTRIATLDTATTTYTDSAVKRSIEYEYRITAVDAAGHISVSPRNIKARPYDAGIREEVRNLTAVYDKERRSVTLRWDYPASEQGTHWFVIYRSIGDGKPMQYATVPADSTSWTEPVSAGETYRYAVRVKSGTGESRLSPIAAVSIE